MFQWVWNMKLANIDISVRHALAACRVCLSFMSLMWNFILVIFFVVLNRTADNSYMIGIIFSIISEL